MKISRMIVFGKAWNYLEYYEKAIEEDVKLLARNNGYEVEQTVVCLDGEYGVEEMEITLLEGDGEGILALRDKIAGYYQIGADKIVIKAD